MEIWKKDFRILMFNGGLPDELENIFEASVNVLYGELCKRMTQEKESGNFDEFLRQSERYEQVDTNALTRSFFKLMVSMAPKTR